MQRINHTIFLLIAHKLCHYRLMLDFKPLDYECFYKPVLMLIYEVLRGNSNACWDIFIEVFIITNKRRYRLQGCAEY